MAHLALHELRRQGDHVHDVGEAAAGIRMQTLLIEDVPLDGPSLAEMGFCDQRAVG